MDPTTWRPLHTFADDLGSYTNATVTYDGMMVASSASGPLLYVFYRVESIYPRSISAEVAEFSLSQSNYGAVVGRANDMADNFTGRADATGYWPRGANILDLKNVAANGPYEPAKSDILVQPVGATFATMTMRIDDLISQSSASNGYPPCTTMSGLAHDPGSKSILVGDTCNGVVWVLRYAFEGSGLTVKAPIQPPSLGPLAYDPTHHVLWSGQYGISVDLSTL